MAVTANPIAQCRAPGYHPGRCGFRYSLGLIYDPRLTCDTSWAGFFVDNLMQSMQLCLAMIHLVEHLHISLLGIRLSRLKRKLVRLDSKRLFYIRAYEGKTVSRHTFKIIANLEADTASLRAEIEAIEEELK